MQTENLPELIKVTRDLRVEMEATLRVQPRTRDERAICELGKLQVEFMKAVETLAGNVIVLREEIAAHEECHESRALLVREIDVIMNGEEGAAPQASLCDLGGQIKMMKMELDGLRSERIIGIPVSVDQANAMAVLGINYLQTHASERLTPDMRKAAKPEKASLPPACEFEQKIVEEMRRMAESDKCAPVTAVAINDLADRIEAYPDVIYADVYGQITDVLEPYIPRSPIQNGVTLPASVTDAYRVLVDAYATIKTWIPAEKPPVTDLDLYGWPTSAPVLALLDKDELMIVTYERKDLDDPDTGEWVSKCSERWTVNNVIGWQSLGIFQGATL